MSNGIQRTPFDTTDLGSQLLQSLVAAQQTKQEREELKLREKQISLQQQQQQLEASGRLVPGAQADILSTILGQQIAPEQVQVPIQEQQFNDLKAYLQANPDINEMFMNIQATGLPFGAGEGLDAARIAARLKSSPQERVQAGFDLVRQFGGRAAAAWNVLAGRELGVRAPAGVPTLDERAVTAAEKQAAVAGAGAEAARVRAKQDLVELFAGGFQKTDPQMTDAEFDQAVGDLIEWAADPSGRVLSPSVLRKIIPTSKYAALLAASAKINPVLEAKMEFNRDLLRHVNDMKGEVPKETLELLQQNILAVQEELYPAPPSDAAALAAPEGRGAVAAGLEWLFDRAVGRVPQISLSGRPLRPELQKLVEDIAGRFSLAGVAKATFGPGLRLAEPGLKALEAAYKKVLPLITTEPAKPPVIAPTLGALSDPQLPVPEQARQQLRGLVAAYRAAGATPDEAAELEQDLSIVIREGDEAAITEMLEAILAEIEEKKAKK